VAGVTNPWIETVIRRENESAGRMNREDPGGPQCVMLASHPRDIIRGMASPSQQRSVELLLVAVLVVLVLWILLASL
jgi:hypothetical protein